MKKIKNLLLSFVMVAGIFGAGNLFASVEIKDAFGEFELGDEKKVTVSYKVHVSGKEGNEAVILSLRTENDRAGWVMVRPYTGDAPEFKEANSSKHKAFVKEEESWTFVGWRTAPDAKDDQKGTLFKVLKSALEEKKVEEEKEADNAVGGGGDDGDNM